MTTLETVPEDWDSDRDEPFFRIVSRLLRGAVVEAASSLLASYDPDPAVSPCDDAGPAQVWLPRQVPTL